MVDTARSKADLQALLADNTDGDIGAQDVRDFLETAMPATTSVITNSHDVVDGDRIILVDYAGAVTVRVMTDQITDGRIFTIKDESGAAHTNNITITTEGSEKIDGASEYVIAKDSGAATLCSDGVSLFVLQPRLTHETKMLYRENPAADDDYPMFSVPLAATIIRVTHITDTGTVDFNLEERADATPDVAGTDVFSADDQAGSTQSVVTSFDNESLAANSWLTYCASAVASTPTKLWVAVTYTMEA